MTQNSIPIYPKEMKTYVHTQACAQMLILDLFIITENYNQLKCPSTCGWINKP